MCSFNWYGGIMAINKWLFLSHPLIHPFSPLLVLYHSLAHQIPLHVNIM